MGRPDVNEEPGPRARVCNLYEVRASHQLWFQAMEGDWARGDEEGGDSPFAVAAAAVFAPQSESDSGSELVADEDLWGAAGFDFAASPQEGLDAAFDGGLGGSFSLPTMPTPAPAGEATVAGQEQGVALAEAMSAAADAEQRLQAEPTRRSQVSRTGADEKEPPTTRFEHSCTPYSSYVQLDDGCQLLAPTLAK